MTDQYHQTWIKVGEADDFPERKKIEKNIDDNLILILRHNDKWYAFEALCPHMSQPLKDARVKGNTLECIWHNMSFNMETGKTIFDSGFINIPDLQVYQIKVQDGIVYVKI